jgi:hypothetical protein
MAAAELSPLRDWIGVVQHELQPRVCKEFGVTQAQLQAAPHWYPELSSRLCFWVRHNRARRGGLQAGDPLVDVPLFRVNCRGGARSGGGSPSTQGLDGMKVNCLEVARAAYPLPLVLVSGSVT